MSTSMHQNILSTAANQIMKTRLLLKINQEDNVLSAKKEKVHLWYLADTTQWLY